MVLEGHGRSYQKNLSNPNKTERAKKKLILNMD